MTIAKTIVAVLLIQITVLAPITNAGKPNIILILSDDAGYQDFSMQGNKDFKTPHIDSIAENGVRFTQGYVSASVCSPSRAGLLTGRYQQKFGHEYNLPARPEKGDDPKLFGLAEQETTLAEALKALDYRTVCIGKWHLGYEPQFHPNQNGFDEFVGLLAGHRSYFPTKKHPRGHELQHNKKVLEDPAYVTEYLSQQACEYIDKYKDEPFFIYLSYTAVHGPMHATEDDLKQFPDIEKPNRKKLAAMTFSMDQGIRNILKALSNRNLTKKTLVIFLNDNGGATNNASSNAPLKGRKGDHFEGGIRVPFVMQWPGKISKNTVYHHPVISLDVFATVIAAAGGKPNKNLDGVNLLPYVRGEIKSRPHETLFWKRGGIATVRHQDWKLIRVKGHPPLLYDLKNDMGEKHNMAKQHTQLVTDLSGKISKWESEHAKPRFKTGIYWENNRIERHSRKQP